MATEEGMVHGEEAECTELVCSQCTKSEGEHLAPVHWVRCYLCAEKSVDVCTGELWEDMGIWSCSKCQKVMLKLRDVVDDWDIVKAAVGIGKKSDQTKDRSRRDRDKMDDMEREIRSWRKKVVDKNYELSKMHKQLRQLEDKVSMLHMAEVEARNLRQKLSEMQGGSYGGGGGGGGGYDNNQPPRMSNWQSNSSDGGGRMMDSCNMPSYKRSAPFDTLSQPSAPKRQAKDQRILFVVDNVLRGIVMNQRLQVEFWRQKWEVRLRRGGSSDVICDTVMSELQLAQYDHVVVCAGAIDLESTSRTDERNCQTIRNHLVDNLQKVAVAVVDAGSEMWIIVPPPRKHGLPWERQACVSELTDVMRPLGTKVGMLRLEEDFDDEMFIHTKLYDGIHIKQDWEVPTIEYILRSMGLYAHISHDDLFAKEEMFGYDRCWRCGGEHKRSITQCREFATCDRCGDRSHHGDVCLFINKMCMTCGERGHGPDKCKLK